MPNPVSCHLNVFVPTIDAPGVDAALDAVAGAGFDWVGLPPLGPGADVRRLRRQLAYAGLRPVVFAVQRADSDVSSDDARVRAAGRDALQTALDHALALDAAHITGVPYAPFGLAEPWSPAARERSARAVGAFAAEAGAAGVPVTFEVLNRYESAAVNTAAEGMDFLELSGSAHLGVHLDGFHMAIEETDPLEALATCGPRLGFLELGQSARGSLARGAVDVGGLVHAAVAGGYRGPIAFEAFSRGLLPAAGADRLRVWRDVYTDAAAIAGEAAALIRSAIGRSAA